MPKKRKQPAGLKAYWANKKKSSTKRKKSTRKGQRRKTARRAYEGIKRKTRKSYKRNKSSSGMKMPKIPSVIKKSGDRRRCSIFSRYGSRNCSASVCRNCSPYCSTSSRRHPRGRRRIIDKSGIIRKHHWNVWWWCTSTSRWIVK